MVKLFIFIIFFYNVVFILTNQIFSFNNNQTIFADIYRKDLNLHYNKEIKIKLSFKYTNTYIVSESDISAFNQDLYDSNQTLYILLKLNDEKNDYLNLNISAYYISDNIFNNSGIVYIIIGLFSFEKENYPLLLNDYKKENYTSKNIISLYTNDTTTLVFMGYFGYNKQMIKIYNDINYCQGSEPWSCKLSSIKIKDKQYNVYSTVKIDLNSNKNYIPLSDYSLLLQYYLKNCSISKEGRIQCKCNNKYEYDIANIKIMDSEITFNIIDFISYNKEEEYQCQFDLFIDKNNFNSWILGNTFMKKYYIYFNYDSYRMGIKNNIDIENIHIEKHIHYSNNTSLAGWIIGLILLLLLYYLFYKCVSEEIKCEQGENLTTNKSVLLVSQ